jgi:xylan 1,4-beta-xylosidase
MSSQSDSSSFGLTFTAGAQGTPLKHYWSTCVGAGRGQEGLRANWQEQLSMAVKHCGFRYLRFHGLFHDDMCVYREQDGKPIYNWQYIDELFDRMLEIGIRPFVELSFFPKDIAAPNSRTQFWWKGNITPPENFDKWAGLVDRFVRHCLQRYGEEEVRQWYFEVWNEPNLYRAFWDGTRSQYFEMYRVTALAIKAIDPALRVGGPATSNFVPDDRFESETEDASKQITYQMKDLSMGKWRGVWIEAFLTFCAKNSLPVDFIACHPYPTDYPLDTGGIHFPRTRPASSTQDDLQWLRDTVEASSFPEAEIHLTEWSSSPSPRDHSHDSLPAATFVVRANVESTGLVDSLSYWVFTDVFEETAAGDTIFHGGFGMINLQGVVKPTFHAYRFLNLLGNEEIGRVQGIIATREVATKAIRVLAYHYPPELRDAPPLTSCPADAEKVLRIGRSRQIKIEISGLLPGTTFELETLDSSHGFCLSAWKEMGAPEPPSREQAKSIREAAWNLRRETVCADEFGTFHLDRELEPWAVVMLREMPIIQSSSS